jgi:hypothetical protein
VWLRTGADQPLAAIPINVSCSGAQIRVSQAPNINSEGILEVSIGRERRSFNAHIRYCIRSPELADDLVGCDFTRPLSDDELLDLI